MTSSKTDIAKALAAEFPPEAVRSLKKQGSSLSYIPISEVITRMNEVVGVENWSVVSSNVYRDSLNPEWVIANVVVEVTLPVEEGLVTNGVTKFCVTRRADGWGGQAVKFKRDTEDPLDLGDEFKGAHSDALKKALQQLGVALYLARSEDMLSLELNNAKAALKEWAEGLQGEEKATFVEWWKDNVKLKIDSDRVELEDVAKAVKEFKIEGIL